MRVVGILTLSVGEWQQILATQLAEQLSHVVGVIHQITVHVSLESHLEAFAAGGDEHPKDTQLAAIELLG